MSDDVRPRSAAGITIVSASAGSGKTYRLTQEVTSAIDPDAPDRVRVEGLFAVTFTKRAEAELRARIRRKLVDARAFDDALRLPLAYLGTVHGTCLRLVQEFALDAGLSPSVDVIAEAEAKLLRQALDGAIEPERRDRMDAMARRMTLRWDARTQRTDWLIDVANVMDLARSNRIEPDALAGMAERSARSYLNLFPMPERDGHAIDNALAEELDRARAALLPYAEKTKKTRDAIELIERSRRQLRDGELAWSGWAKLAALEPAAACASLASDLRLAAARHESHPDLHRDIQHMTRGVFEAARAGLLAYAKWKRERRVVDYVDMLDRALDLLAVPRVVAELRERIAFSIVDEFQDTSPIQLALFLRIHSIAGRSTWVGDRKQCIFEYAGADPLLMDRVSDWISAVGGTKDHLRDNHRSRPELVHACSELFASALERHGFKREEVVVAPKRECHPRLDALPPFGVFFLETSSTATDAAAIASGVARVLRSPGATPVLDRHTQTVRDVRPGDIAVLVATNAEARAISEALFALGLRAAIARAGVLATPEGRLVDAALHWLVDERDALAAATIDALSGFGGDSPGRWLTGKLGGDSSPSVWRSRLEPTRQALILYSPSEAVDAVIAALDVVLLAARWPDGEHRVANLDALRALATGYEERSSQEREAATVAGLLRYFDDMQAPRLKKDEMIASDDQHVPGDDEAVVISTYHKAKGLEWPVVVLGSLDRPERRGACEVSPESDGTPFDPAAPLLGRWIRFWPYPYGKSKSELSERIATTEEGRRVAAREDEERARLLYVGFTRARDHLVLAARSTESRTGTHWLDALSDRDGLPLVVLPTAARDGSVDAIHLGSASVPARVWRCGLETSEAQGRRHGGVWFRRGPPAPNRARYRIAPSKAALDWPELPLPSMGSLSLLAGSMPIIGVVSAWDDLGDVVHAFLAADSEHLTEAQRLAHARRLVAERPLDERAMLGMADRLRTFVDQRWPSAIWRREVPIEVAIGDRRLTGAIDLLLETSGHFVIIDHKCFPGRGPSAWRARAVECLPQLAAYAEALRRLGPKPVSAAWIHFPIGGAMLEVRV